MSHVWHKNLVFCKKAAQSAVSEEKQAFTAKIESGAPPAQGRRKAGAEAAQAAHCRNAFRRAFTI